MLDKYCLECGESVPMNADECTNCSSVNLDIMDIDNDIVK